MINITPQAREIYKLLSHGESSQSLTVKEIGGKLNILPNVVYRSIKALERFKFVRREGRYPVHYTALNPDDGIDFFTRTIKESLNESLYSGNRLGDSTNGINLSFISNRVEQFEKDAEDLIQATKQASLIVSGLDVPEETLLEYKRAADRGVKIRLIVQNLKEVTKVALNSWQKMGMKVKYYPIMEARIIIFDAKIVYITSYDPKRKEEAIGVRFQYSPIAQILQELFDQRWSQAKEIKL